jgi:hypothetical protein
MQVQVNKEQSRKGLHRENGEPDRKKGGIFMMWPVGPDAAFLWLYREKWFDFTDEERERIRNQAQRRLESIKIKH